MEPKGELDRLLSYMSNPDGGFRIFDTSDTTYIVPNNMSNLQAMLIKEAVTAKLIPEAYNSDSTTKQILYKLEMAKTKLEKFTIDQNSEDYLTIVACIEGINDGKSLSKELMTTINQIYKKYNA